jgi:putative toxin-antitoxin system antitoxin component (TIGR02293 family)
MALMTTSQTKKVVNLLGGAKVFHRKLLDSNEMAEVLRAGFPFAAFQALVKAIAAKPVDLAEVLGMAERTLARRKGGKFKPIESDRLYRVAYITMLATETLGSLEKARDWLFAPNRALGGLTPISGLDTEIGQRQVEDILSRINYGIYS